MNKEREELLLELTKGTIPNSKILKACWENMETGDVINVTMGLMQWQKHVAKDRGEFYLPSYLPDKMPIDDVVFERYSSFFKFCPEINDLFTLEADKVTYNKDLTTVEIQEIRDFVNQNYEVSKFIRRK